MCLPGLHRKRRLNKVDLALANYLLPTVFRVTTSLCFLMIQEVTGSVFQRSFRRKVSRQGLNLVINLPSLQHCVSSFLPSNLYRVLEERQIVSCQYLIINFHQHCESRMDGLASRVVTPGMGFNGPSKEERGWVYVCVSATLYVPGCLRQLCVCVWI